MVFIKKDLTLETEYLPHSIPLLVKPLCFKQKHVQPFAPILTLDHIVHFLVHLPNMHLSCSKYLQHALGTKPCMYSFTEQNKT